MNRNQLRAILKINGYTEESSDDEIRAVLLQAKYTESEITKAIQILRTKDITSLVRSDGLHTVFYTDGHLKPKEIAGLLGVEANFSGEHFKLEDKNNFELNEVLIIMGLSAFISVLGIVIFMFSNQIGLFHPA